MRKLLFAAVFLALPLLYTAEPSGVLGAPAIAVAADEAPSAPDAAKPNVDVNINRTERHVFSVADPMVLAIGPEGGWVEAELDMARSRGIRLTTFGPRTLRADAAAVAVLSVLQFLWD